MGLAASQVRLLTLTSDKLSLEKQMMLNTNRKMALTAEMSRLAIEKNCKMNSFQYQVSTINNGLQEISYEYLMGKSGGVQDIETKSEDKMMLFESSTGRVVLSEDMANKIGDVSKLRANQNEKYAAIARLCGDTHLTVPDDVPEYLNFCADPDLVKSICDGKYNSYSINDVTNVINKYFLNSYFVKGDKSSDVMLEAFKTYRTLLDEVGGGNHGGLYNASHPDEHLATGTIEGTSITWANAIQKTRYVDNNIIFAYDTHGATVSKNTATGEDMRNYLTTVVTGLAQDYSNLTGFSMTRLQKAINQTVNEFYENSSTDFSTTDFSDSGMFLPHTNPEDNYVLHQTSSNFDKDHLRVYTTTFGFVQNPQVAFGIDASALVTYFYAALMGEGVGYNSVKNGMDTYVNSGGNNYKTKILMSERVLEPVDNNAYTPNMNEDKHLFQRLVPAGVNSDQWIESFNKLISDVKFYYPIVEACIKFGYTTDYDDLIKNEPSYVDESLQNGTFQIMDFDAEKGNLDGSHNTKYYLMFSEIFKMDNESEKLAVQAWYQREKSSIKHKEDILDTQIEQMNTELNSINTEIESIKSYIDDSKNKFNWCNG